MAASEAELVEFPVQHGQHVEEGTPIYVIATEKVEQEIEAGDHLIVLGRVVELKAVHRGRPLVFYRAGFGSFEA